MTSFPFRFIRKFIVRFRVVTYPCPCGGRIGEDPGWSEMFYRCNACGAYIAEDDFEARLRAAREAAL